MKPIKPISQLNGFELIAAVVLNWYGPKTQELVDAELDRRHESRQAA